MGCASTASTRVSRQPCSAIMVGPTRPAISPRGLAMACITLATCVLYTGQHYVCSCRTLADVLGIFFFCILLVKRPCPAAVLAWHVLWLTEAQ